MGFLAGIGNSCDGSVGADGGAGGAAVCGTGSGVFGAGTGGFSTAPGFTRLTTVASPSDASVEDRTSRQTAIDCGRSFARRARPASIPGSVPAEKPASERPAKGS